MTESNCRPPVYETIALPTELIGQIKQDDVTLDRDSNPYRHMPPTGWPGKFWLRKMFAVVILY